jgi:hypothetical protein
MKYQEQEVVVKSIHILQTHTLQFSILPGSPHAFAAETNSVPSHTYHESKITGPFALLNILQTNVETKA